MSNVSTGVSLRMVLQGSDGPHPDGATAKQRQQQQEKERIQRVDQYYSRKTRQICYAKTPKEDVKTRDKQRRYCIVIRRIINARGLPQGVEIDVKSPKLVDVLRDIFRDAESLALAESDESPVVSPDTLFLAWGRLEAREAEEKSKQQPDTQLLDDLSVTLGYLDKDYGAKRAEMRGLLEEGLITFELLGRFFMPNCEVFTDKNELKEPQVMKLVSGSYEQSQSGERFYVVLASLITHDGEDLGWGQTKVKLSYFGGNMKIVDLTVFPLDWHPQQESIRHDLANRGRQFVTLLREPVCAWYGATAVCSVRTGSDWEEVKFLANKRVMVDPSTWMIHNHSHSRLRAPFVPDKKSILHSVLEGDLLFCNHRILGFSFEEKRWGAFAVSRLSDPKWDEAAFGKVILPQDQLALIRDLVLSHRTRSKVNDRNEEDGADDDDDIIKGKGQGLVGLLSGNPGVGKTLTAEAVSEVSHRPLYAVSAGELGTAVDEVDRRLGMVLDITRRWRCVLLIDEADVFLHKREDDVSLERNAVVSVFLRRLEYFRGVAILTTNRDFDIDVAFMSRIHFKFHHKDLDPPTLFCIWKNMLAKELSAPEASINEADLQQLANQYHTLSGREIKNAAFCAKSISRIREAPLNLQLISKTIQNFGFLPRGRQLDAGHLLVEGGSLKRAAADESHGDAKLPDGLTRGISPLKKLRSA